jgi:hypothetical protein
MHTDARARVCLSAQALRALPALAAPGFTRCARNVPTAYIVYAALPGRRCRLPAPGFTRQSPPGALRHPLYAPCLHSRLYALFALSAVCAPCRTRLQARPTPCALPPTSRFPPRPDRPAFSALKHAQKHSTTPWYMLLHRSALRAVRRLTGTDGLTRAVAAPVERLPPRAQAPCTWTAGLHVDEGLRAAHGRRSTWSTHRRIYIYNYIYIYIYN